MNTSTSTIQEPIFYFNDVKQLAEFESFEVKPCTGNHDASPASAANADWWSVVGKLKAENVVNPKQDTFPVADFHNEMYAALFAQLCSTAATASPDDAVTGAITDGFGQVLMA